MLELDCSVTGCRYNEDYCCCKDKIKVEGEDAKTAEHTCCGSFAEKKGDCYCNQANEPTKATAVACKAENCIYNAKGYCDASHIGIEGGMASTSEQTECGSFRCK